MLCKPPFGGILYIFYIFTSSWSSEWQKFTIDWLSGTFIYPQFTSDISKASPPPASPHTAAGLTASGCESSMFTLLAPLWSDRLGSAPLAHSSWQMRIYTNFTAPACPSPFLPPLSGPLPTTLEDSGRAAAGLAVRWMIVGRSVRTQCFPDSS